MCGMLFKRVPSSTDICGSFTSLYIFHINRVSLLAKETCLPLRGDRNPTDRRRGNCFFFHVVLDSDVWAHRLHSLHHGGIDARSPTGLSASPDAASLSHILGNCRQYHRSIVAIVQ